MADSNAKSWLATLLELQPAIERVQTIKPIYKQLFFMFAAGRYTGAALKAMISFKS